MSEGEGVMTEHISCVIFPRESEITLAHITKQDMVQKKLHFTEAQMWRTQCHNNQEPTQFSFGAFLSAVTLEWLQYKTEGHYRSTVDTNVI